MSIDCFRISLSVIQSTNFLMRSFYLKRSRPNLGYVINCSIVRVNRIFRYYRRYEQKFCARERRYSMRMRLLFLGSRWLVLTVHQNEKGGLPRPFFQDLPKTHQNSVKIIEEFFWQICLYQVAPGGGGGVGSSERINRSKERKDFQKITNNGGDDSQSSWPWGRKAILVQCTVQFKGSAKDNLTLWTRN